MSRVLDDMDSRPGSATSLLRTITGLYLRRLGGHFSSATMVAGMSELGVSASRTRTAIVRLKQRGLLVAGSATGATPAPPGAGYQLNEDAIAMLEAGDRRIFRVTRMTNTDPWCLISFSLPEELRAVRHQVRRRLHWIGCGTVAPGLWICPASLRGEVVEIVAELELAAAVTTFTATQPQVHGSLADSISRWWDLESLANRHREFIDTVAGAGLLDTSPGAAHPGSRAADAVAWRNYVTGVDAWRMLPYLDPGLPHDLLPADWPGHASAAVFHDISERFSAGSWRHLRRLSARPELAAVRGHSDQSESDSCEVPPA